MKIIVLAGSRQQFEEYLRGNGLTDTQAIYGYAADKIMGIEASKVEIIGNFWDRKDAAELKKLAESRVKNTMEDKELKKLKYSGWMDDDNNNGCVIGAHLTLEEVKRWAILTGNEDEEQITHATPTYTTYGNWPKEMLDDWGEEKHNGYWEVSAESHYKRKMKVTKYFVDYKIPVTKQYFNH